MKLLKFKKRNSMHRRRRRHDDRLGSSSCIDVKNNLDCPLNEDIESNVDCIGESIDEGNDIFFDLANQGLCQCKSDENINECRFVSETDVIDPCQCKRRQNRSDCQIKQGAIPLSFAPYGEELEIVQINVNERIKRRFCSLGLLIGVKVTSFSRDDDCVILKIRDTKLALNKALAMKILVA